MADGKSTRLIAETYHSRIEELQLGNISVVRKTANRKTDRTVAQWTWEVRILSLIAEHAGSLSRFMSQIIDSSMEDLSITMRPEPGRSLDLHVDKNHFCMLASHESDLVQSQIGDALKFLHGQYIMHDDVKPENFIFVSDEQRAVLIDFGAALTTDSDGNVEFNMSGTPPYAPPEYMQRQKSRAGDVWALGVTMLFAKQYIKLPDGDWILPHTFEQEEPRARMSAWLKEIEDWREDLIEKDSKLAGMLHSDTKKRLIAGDTNRDRGLD